MSLRRKLLVRASVLTALIAAPFVSRAQDFGLGVTVAPNPVTVNNPVLYSIDVTNFLGFSLNNVFVTNAFSGPFVVNGATNSLVGTITTNSSEVVFRINTLVGGGLARMTLSLTPTQSGPFTNQITVAQVNRTNTTTNVVVQVNPLTTDLAVSMTNVASGILTNDATAIGLMVTNRGPATASGVMLTNGLPPSFKLLSVSPAGASNTFAGGNLVLHLGTLTSGSSTQLQVFVQPTNAGSFNLTASVAASNVLDTNTANNAVTNNMVVSGFLDASLAVTVVTQHFNPQTGLLEMGVRLTNNGGTNVPAARILVTGLTNGTWLYNAVGTNSGAAYVLHNAALAGGASVDLLLEYYVFIRAPLTNYNLQAFAVPVINLQPPSTQGIVIAGYTNSSGGFLIEFTATPGATYTIIYSDNLSFSNALTAQPSIIAPANRVQWVDNGPPKTVSHPTSVPARYYRVLSTQ